MPFVPDQPKKSGFVPDVMTGVTPEELRTQTRAGVGLYPEEKVTDTEKSIAQALPVIRGINPIIGELVSRLSPGVKLQERAQAESFLRGGLRTISGGLSDPILERISAVVNPLTGGLEESGTFRTRQEAGPERFAPFSAALGEVASAAAPAGTIGAATTVPSLLLRSGTAGGLFGAAGGLTEELQRPRAEGESVSINEALQAMLFPAAVGTGLGLAIPGLGAAAGKLGQRIPPVIRTVANVPEAFDVTIQNSAMNLFKPKGEALTGQIIEGTQSGVFQDSLRNIRSKGKPTNVEEMIQFGADASDDLIKRHNTFVAANKGIVTNNDDIGQAVLGTLEGRRLVSENARDEITDLAKNVSGNGSLKEDFNLLRELNEETASYFLKTQNGQNSALDDARFRAQKLARDMLSSKLDSQYQLLTNTTDNPYRQYGALRGLLDPLRVRLNDLLKQRGIQKSQGLSLDRELLSTLKKNKSLLTGGEKAEIDSEVVRIFNTLDEAPQPTRIQALPPVITSPETSLTPQDILNQRIARSIQSQGLPPAALGSIPLEQIVGGVAPPVSASGVSLDALIRASVEAQEAARQAQLQRALQGQLGEEFF